jgi:hypothetical protein
MSSLHESLVQQEMEESGEMDFIRDHVAAANAAAAGETPAPAPADTVESEEGTVEGAEEAATPAATSEEEGQAEGTEATPLTPEEEDTIYLELDDDTQALIDTKYGGDINKALAALSDGQSLIGRQGNELGALREEMRAFREQVQDDMRSAQPYPEFPDEFADGPEAAAQLRLVAEAAFDRRDPEMFQRAISQWEEADPVSAAMYRDLKEMQVMQIQAQEAPVQVDDGDTLEAGIQTIIAKHPQFQDESFKAAVAAELEKTPSLKAVLWGEVPGVSVKERVLILDEAAQRVAARTTSETVQQAKKRVAVRNSEEARAARVAAQSVRGGTARDEAPEAEARTVQMGESGRSLNIDRLNAMLSEEDRL